MTRVEFIVKKDEGDLEVVDSDMQGLTMLDWSRSKCGLVSFRIRLELH